MKLFRRRFQVTACLKNSEAAQKILELKRLPSRSQRSSNSSPILKAINVLRSIDVPLNGKVLDAVLSLIIQQAQFATVHSIWPDIELFHKHQSDNSSNPFNYSLLLKCLLRSDDLDLARCITALRWIENANGEMGFTLKIHSSLITKLVSICGSDQCLQSLQCVHRLIQKGIISTKSNDKYVVSALIKSYGSCKDPLTAVNVFQSFPNDQLDSVILGAVMTALINNYHYTKAIEIYESHDQSLRNDVIKNLAMKAYTKTSQYTQSMKVYSEMDSISNKSSDLMLLKTATKGSMIDIAHKFRKKEIPMDLQIVVHLLNLYGKCGMIEDADRVFNAQYNSPNISDVTLWNSMIRVYGRNNRLNDVLWCYQKMKDSSIAVDCNTFVVLMNACNHCGDTQRTRKIWSEEVGDLMEIKYDEKVISVLIDAMSKEGELEEALMMLESIAESAYESAWIALLDGSRRQNDLEFGERVYREIWKRFESDSIVMSSAATLISHIYTKNGEMGKRKSVRKLMERRGWNNTKRHGKATVQIDGVIYTFCAGLNYQEKDCLLNDKEKEEIEQILDVLCRSLKAELGFEHDTSAVTNRVRNESERIKHVREHSEKLALCYWLLRRPDSAEIMIGSSQRMCDDCHQFMIAVSRLNRVTITVAEPNILHVFRDGVCSCQGYLK